jgi:ERCC4-type nuclease
MKIIVDHWEKRSKVIESLEKLGADIEITTLKVGESIMTAPREEVMKVERVGSGTADRIRGLAGERYDL